MRYLGLFCFGILRGSCFVAQAGLELVIFLIAGITGVSPHPEGICVVSPTAALCHLDEQLSRDVYLSACKELGSNPGKL